MVLDNDIKGASGSVCARVCSGAGHRSGAPLESAATGRRASVGRRGAIVGDARGEGHIARATAGSGRHNDNTRTDNTRRLVVFDGNREGAGVGVAAGISRGASHWRNTLEEWAATGRHA